MRNTVEIDAKEAFKGVCLNVSVKGLAWALIRVKLGMPFVRFGVWIAGVTLTVTRERDNG